MPSTKTIATGTFINFFEFWFLCWAKNFEFYYPLKNYQASQKIELAYFISNSSDFCFFLKFSNRVWLTDPCLYGWQACAIPSLIISISVCVCVCVRVRVCVKYSALTEYKKFINFIISVLLQLMKEIQENYFWFFQNHEFAAVALILRELKEKTNFWKVD